jgi:Reverse transcriptase (RNA-dependent DNA polymerase)
MKVFNDLLPLLKSYLHLRTQYTEINGCKSELLNISFGVPQGSVLGPLLFILFLNDITTIDSKVSNFLFADDAAFVLSCSDAKSLQSSTNLFLLKLSFWLDTNRFCPNVDKTNYIIFSPNHLNPVSDFNVKFYDRPLTRSYQTKYLGVTITHNLSWQPHIDKLCESLSKSLCYFYKLRHVCTVNTCITLYYALIYSQLTYCCTIWGLTYKSHLGSVLKMQKKFMRIITFSKKDTHITPFFTVFKLLNIFSIVKLLVCKHVYRVLSNSLPLAQTNFTLIQETHRYGTRSACEALLIIPQCTTHQTMHCMEYTGASMWNSLPARIRFSNSLSLFIMHMKQFLWEEIASSETE